MTVENRLRTALGVLGGVVLTGTAGYMLIEGWSLLDSVYMTVITISTVGFMEVHELTDQGRVFAILLIICGVGAMMYGITVFFQMLVEGQIRGLLGKYKLQRGIKTMKDHYIVCGYGRVGQRVVNDLRQRGEMTVVIESEPDKLEWLKEHMVPFVPGDATNDDNLRSAGVERAKGLIVALPDHSQNVFVTLSARQLNKNLRIVARNEEDADSQKLMIAGANAIVNPHDMGGERMVLEAAEPDVVGYVRIGEDYNTHPVRIDRIHVTAGSLMCNVPIDKIPVFNEFRLLLIAIQRKNGDLHFKPSGSERPADGDTLVVAGYTDQLSIVRQVMSQMRRGAPADPPTVPG